MQKIHGRFEWNVTKTGEIFSGNGFQEVFDKMAVIHMEDGATLKTKCNIYLLKNGIEETLQGKTELSNDDFLKLFFEKLQEKLIGTWKWYDSLIGEHWRFSAQDNDLVPRGSKKPMTEERRKHLIENLEKANKKLKNDPNLLEYRRRGGFATMNANVNVMHEGRDNFFKNATAEQRAERGRKISEALKRAHANPDSGFNKKK